jgi:hypothetical protein
MHTHELIRYFITDKILKEDKYKREHGGGRRYRGSKHQKKANMSKVWYFGVF